MQEIDHPRLASGFTLTKKTARACAFFITIARCRCVVLFLVHADRYVVLLPAPSCLCCAFCHYCCCARGTRTRYDTIRYARFRDKGKLIRDHCSGAIKSIYEQDRAKV